MSKTKDALREEVAKAIFDKFVEGDSYGWGDWHDFLDEAEAAIDVVLKFQAKTQKTR
jgi:hypothetical protein